jgi:single-strand DNA-binding protein
MQKLILIGNAGVDADFRYTPNGTPIVSFSVADNQQKKNEDKIISQTTWFRVTAWKNLAEIAENEIPY